jgi:hypothetical protein
MNEVDLKTTKDEAHTAQRLQHSVAKVVTKPSSASETPTSSISGRCPRHAVHFFGEPHRQCEGTTAKRDRVGAGARGPSVTENR